MEREECEKLLQQHNHDNHWAYAKTSSSTYATWLWVQKYAHEFSKFDAILWRTNYTEHNIFQQTTHTMVIKYIFFHHDEWCLKQQDF